MVLKLRWPVLGLGILLGLGINVAEAQVQATVVLKSGERHTGRNLGYRMDAREVSVRTSQNEEPRINVNQVDYVDFGGTADRPTSMSGSQEAVVLRDGTVLRGQVIQLGHMNPADESTDYLVTIRTEGGEERRLAVKQVGRVYFAGGGGGAAAGGSTKGEAQLDAATGDGIVVSARQQWTPTGLTVRKGDQLSFQTTGQVQLSEDSKDVAGSAGSLAQRKAERAPLPGNLAGALIGRIGNGEPFPIGDQRSVAMPGTGQLFLGINDDELGDNRGEFRVKVSRPGRR